MSLFIQSQQSCTRKQIPVSIQKDMFWEENESVKVLLKDDIMNDRTWCTDKNNERNNEWNSKILTFKKNLS